MRPSIIFGLAAAAFTLTAHAGFVDKRVEPAPAQAAASAPEAAATATVSQVPAAASLGPNEVFVLTPASKAGSGGVVTGYLDLPGWSKPAPNVAALKGSSPGVPEPFVAFGDAIFRLLPAGHPPVVLDGPQEVLALPVTWSDGQTRRAALDQVAATAGLQVEFTGKAPGSTLKVAKSSVSVPASPATVPAPASIVESPPAMTPVRSARSVPTVVVPAASAPAAIVEVAAVATPVAVVAVAPSTEPTMQVAHVTSNKLYEVKLSDIRLSTAFSRWAQENNVRIRWDADKQVLVEPTVFSAPNVLDAIAQALMTPGIRNSDYPLEACEYPNTPRLIRITRQGEQAKDCPQ